MTVQCATRRVGQHFHRRLLTCHHSYRRYIHERSNMLNIIPTRSMGFQCGAISGNKSCEYQYRIDPIMDLYFAAISSRGQGNRPCLNDSPCRQRKHHSNYFQLPAVYIKICYSPPGPTLRLMLCVFLSIFICYKVLQMYSHIRQTHHQEPHPPPPERCACRTKHGCEIVAEKQQVTPCANERPIKWKS